MKLLNVVLSLAILYMVQEQSHMSVKGPHRVLLMPSVCVVKGNPGCAKSLSGLEDAWDWDEDVQVCGNLTSEGKWQIQNTVAISRSQFNSRESK